MIIIKNNNQRLVTIECYQRRFLLLILVCVCQFATVNAQQLAQRLQLADSMEYSLNNELLDKYYPACFDTLYGGFITTFSYDFKPVGEQDKFIVTQARHVWTTSMAYMLYPHKQYFLIGAANGFRFLKDYMWDKKNGGFYNFADRQGHVKNENRNVAKEAYGNSFAIYALTAYYKASKDTAALSLAKQTFWWLEAHSHDTVYKGYYQHLQNDGTPVKRPAGLPLNSEIGYKDQNSSIHLLEAFTALYEVWPDAILRERLQEMLLLIRDKLVTKKGYLQLFFTPDWKPVSLSDSSVTIIRKYKSIDHVSFGHDVETAYLMLEASQALHFTNDTTTMTVAKRMLDHALANGWDSKAGGFYNEGYYFKDKPGNTILFDSKNWWTQAEGLNTLLMMADYFPGDVMHYYEHFLAQWKYINTYTIDHVYGDWYEEGIDKQPQRKTSLKAHTWKATYHNFRSLDNCIKRLRNEGHQ